MIAQKDSGFPVLDEAAVTASARLAAVHARYGELRLPPRIADALGDVPEVQLRVSWLVESVPPAVRVADHRAVRDGDKLSGFAWPEGVAAGTVVGLACARRTGVLYVALPATGEVERRLAADEAGASTVEAEVVTPVPDVESAEPIVVERPDWPGAEDAAANETTAVLAPVEAPGVLVAVEQTEVFAPVGQAPVHGVLVDALLEAHPAPAAVLIAAVLDGDASDDGDVVDAIGPDYAQGLAHAMAHGLPEETATDTAARQGDVLAALERNPDGSARLFDWLTMPSGTGSWLRRNLTVSRVAVLCVVVGILLGTGIGWWAL